MLIPDYRGAFKKDLAKIQRRGKDITKLISIICMLVGEAPLPAKYEDHALKGDYVGHRDCHIEPDWVLIYMVDKPYISFVRTGSHSDLF